MAVCAVGVWLDCKLEAVRVRCGVKFWRGNA